ncbi:MAG: AraC family transcriptional regulator [Terricaulis sp.]
MALDDSAVFERAGIGVLRRTYAPGVIESAGSTRHWLTLQLGEAVEARCVCGGDEFSGVLAPRGIDIVPAGADGRWECFTIEKAALFSVEPRLLADCAAELGIAALALPPSFQVEDEALVHILHALLGATKGDASSNTLLVESLGQALVARLVCQHMSAPWFSNGNQQLTVRQKRRVIEYIDARLAENISLADVALAAGVGVSHLKVLFKRSFGTPVHQYIIGARVRLAENLIKRGGLSLSDVAAAAGFAHQSHLAKCMRRLSGLTPSDLARRVRDPLSAIG